MPFKWTATQLFGLVLTKPPPPPPPLLSHTSVALYISDSQLRQGRQWIAASSIHCFSLKSNRSVTRVQLTFEKSGIQKVKFLNSPNPPSKHLLQSWMDMVGGWSRRANKINPWLRVPSTLNRVHNINCASLRHPSIHPMLFTSTTLNKACLCLYPAALYCEPFSLLTTPPRIETEPQITKIKKSKSPKFLLPHPVLIIINHSLKDTHFAQIPR